MSVVGGAEADQDERYRFRALMFAPKPAWPL